MFQRLLNQIAGSGQVVVGKHVYSGHQDQPWLDLDQVQLDSEMPDASCPYPVCAGFCLDHTRPRDIAGNIRATGLGKGPQLRQFQVGYLLDDTDRHFPFRGSVQPHLSDRLVEHISRARRPLPTRRTETVTGTADRCQCRPHFHPDRRQAFAGNELGFQLGCERVQERVGSQPITCQRFAVPGSRLLPQLRAMCRKLGCQNPCVFTASRAACEKPA